MGRRLVPKTELRHLFIQLQGQFPAQYPIRLKFTSKLPEGEWGDVDLIKLKGQPTLRLQLSTRLDSETSLVILFHEYAHCLDWKAKNDANLMDHSPLWGVHLSRIWSWYSEDQGIWA